MKFYVLEERDDFLKKYLNWIEIFYNSLFSVKSRHNLDSSDWKEQNFP